MSEKIKFIPYKAKKWDAIQTMRPKKQPRNTKPNKY